MGKDNSMELPPQRHDFPIAPRCLSGRSFSPLQYHADETAVSSLIHCSTKAMVLQYHFIWYRRGTGKDLLRDAGIYDCARAELNLFNLVDNELQDLSNDVLKNRDFSFTHAAILRFICIIIQNYAKHSGKKFFFFKKTYYFCILDHMNKTKYFRILRLNYHYVRRTSES